MKILNRILKTADTLDAILGHKGKITFINKYIGEYGEMLTLEIDHKNKHIASSILLKGEKEPIKLEIDQYEIKQAEATIQIGKATCDKPWIDALLKNFVVGKKWDIPDGLSDKLGLLVDFLG